MTAKKNSPRSKAPGPTAGSPASPERIEGSILLLRGEKVLLDADLADLYGVETKALTRAVRRNQDRFPEDFAFQLSREEWDILRSRLGTSSWGGRRYRPLAFTEHGVAMLSAVLRSSRAVAVSLAVVRSFVRLRRLLATEPDLSERLTALEKKVGSHDTQLLAAFQAIRKLMRPELPEVRRRIGFRDDNAGR